MALKQYMVTLDGKRSIVYARNMDDACFQVTGKSINVIGAEVKDSDLSSKDIARMLMKGGKYYS